MSTGTSIQWTEATWNPVAGCTPVSPGCLHCYAATMSHRLDKMGQEKYRGLTVLNNGIRTFNGKIKLVPDALSIPLKRKKPTMYFVNSMSDLFHEDMPFDYVDRVFAVMGECSQHTFQVLTKRPERMDAYLHRIAHCRDGPYSTRERIEAEWRKMDRSNPSWHEWPLPNVWLGTSVENQKCADERIPHLLRCPASVRFLSVEPLLGPVNLDKLEPGKGMDGLDCLRGGWHQGDGRIYEKFSDSRGHEPRVDWVIVGGESGPGARPCNIEWIRSIVKQCKAAGISVFCKQLGSQPIESRAGDIPIHMMLKDSKGGAMEEWPEDLRIRQFPKPL